PGWPGHTRCPGRARDKRLIHSGRRETHCRGQCLLLCLRHPDASYVRATPSEDHSGPLQGVALPKGGPDTRGVRVAPATRGSDDPVEWRPTVQVDASSCAFDTRTHPTSGPLGWRVLHGSSRVARTHDVFGSRSDERLDHSTRLEEAIALLCL